MIMTTKKLFFELSLVEVHQDATQQPSQSTSTRINFLQDHITVKNKVETKWVVPLMSCINITINKDHALHKEIKSCSLKKVNVTVKVNIV